ncbi:sensor domain-containing diguanylate cyclase [Rhodospirillum centenum]|uniref:diguanylate cyclase n=1 Tax=Rhodospirillum centenum (strain ATCC 51521 / SW) TaxID=414684 RepID=B6IY91_RHOCS|nr:diguanylate cyclase [Rhodospirillum centenum]ACJ01265.1 diguanylate cyclase, putative [Rhodospirillum centenum SW]
MTGRIDWIRRGGESRARQDSHDRQDGVARLRPVQAVADRPSSPDPPVPDGSTFDALFATNAAPILLIDPERDGAIVDVNPKAAEFYGHSRERFRTLHVWDINTLDRSVLPVMREISSWSGGHYPQRFRHRMADGSLRDVQVYAGPIQLQGRRLLLCIIHDVTAVIEAELFNRLLLESVQDGVCGVDLLGNVTFVNPAAVQAFGYSHESELMRGGIGRFLVPGGTGAAAHPVLQVAATGSPVRDLECPLFRQDGSPFPARITASPVRGRDGVVGVVVSFCDLTEEKERDARVTDLTNSLPGAVFQAEIRPDGRVLPTYFSSAANTLVGLPPGADLTMPGVLAGAMSRKQWIGVLYGLRRAAREGVAWDQEFHVHPPEAGTDGAGGADPAPGRWLLGRARPRPRPDGTVSINGVLLDITERKRLEASLEQAALNDPLTGVWNRRRFEQALEEAAARALRYGRPFSLLLIDIDHFKQFNDTHGHALGDRALQMVAGVLAGRSRQVDCLARWGGEEFSLLLPETDAVSAQALASDLRRAVAALSIADVGPGDVGPGGVTVSIGVGQATPGESIDALFRRVDAALYRAKAAGRNQVHLA